MRLRNEPNTSNVRWSRDERCSMNDITKKPRFCKLENNGSGHRDYVNAGIQMDSQATDYDWYLGLQHPRSPRVVGFNALRRLLFLFFFSFFFFCCGTCADLPESYVAVRFANSRPIRR